MVPAGSQVSGVVVQIRGGSVIVGPLPGQLAGSAVWAHALVRRRGTRVARAFGRAVAPHVGCLGGFCAVEVYSHNSIYQSGPPDLNRRPLDPQSCSVRRWTSPGVAQWALDQA